MARTTEFERIEKFPWAYFVLQEVRGRLRQHRITVDGPDEEEQSVHLVVEMSGGVRQVENGARDTAHISDAR